VRQEQKADAGNTVKGRPVFKPEHRRAFWAARAHCTAKAGQAEAAHKGGSSFSTFSETSCIFLNRTMCAAYGKIAPAQGPYQEKAASLWRKCP
jgi:hypothetical protein